MGIFKKRTNRGIYTGTTDSATLAQRALDYIAEGVLLIDEGGMIQFANPAAAVMSGYNAPEHITGLDYQLVVRLQSPDGVPIEPNQTALYTALRTNAAMTSRDYLLLSAQTEKCIAVELTVIPTGGIHEFRIVTFRDITRELAEEHEQAEFISTASHEMRTPVASIEGYLGLATNPQTATIDARARQYLEAAHNASKHLGQLFKDLLDVTKLDDKRMKARLVPVDAVEVVKSIAMAHEKEFRAKKQKFSFGNDSPSVLDKKRIEPKVYMAVDMDFLKEIVDNLVGNAIKYTPEGGEIWVNARGDGDQVLINVTDTGIGISPDDAAHVFQKFYRCDNSQTRQIGGTGLGLYLVKQRCEALGGRVWLESSFGEGCTFFVSLPRLSESEYEKMSIAQASQGMVKNFSAPAMMQQQQAPVPQQQAVPTPAQQAPVIAPNPVPGGASGEPVVTGPQRSASVVTSGSSGNGTPAVAAGGGVAMTVPTTQPGSRVAASGSVATISTVQSGSQGAVTNGDATTVSSANVPTAQPGGQGGVVTSTGQAGSQVAAQVSNTPTQPTAANPKIEPAAAPVAQPVAPSNSTIQTNPAINPGKEQT